MAKKVKAEERRRRAPKGHFVVYVGNEMKRFVIPTYFLKIPIFQQLLDEAAEEYGYNYQLGILLPCNESSFINLIAFLKKHY
ncbi:hypothetical protein MANES_18G102900v8 [Manihot esculenta]|uniref:SAUR family protein n=1 Tax=Manihot esculenta TaxID=3983 RepID=A0A2C9U338_MANES|nr:hypothetical protein MANES_18G102900v8 [Manihot esculenta]